MNRIGHSRQDKPIDKRQVIQVLQRLAMDRILFKPAKAKFEQVPKLVTEMGSLDHVRHVQIDLSALSIIEFLAFFFMFQPLKLPVVYMQSVQIAKNQCHMPEYPKGTRPVSFVCSYAFGISRWHSFFAQE